jgi:hypothetical protein
LVSEGIPGKIPEPILAGHGIPEIGDCLTHCYQNYQNVEEAKNEHPRKIQREFRARKLKESREMFARMDERNAKFQNG